MLTSGWTIFLGIVAAVAAGVWYFLDRKIKEEEQENKVEPDLNDLFSEFATSNDEKKASSLDVSKPTKSESKFDPSSSISFETTTLSSKGWHKDSTESKAHSKLKLSEPLVEDNAPVFSSIDEMNRDSSQELENLDLFGDTQHSADTDLDDKKSKKMFDYVNVGTPLVEKVKGFFGSSSAANKSKIFDDSSMGLQSVGHNEIHRPAPVMRIALILKAPEEQPYTLHEILEVADQLQLVIGRSRYIDHLTTTLYGEEPMFSIAHLLHPGTFDEEFIAEDMYREIPGLLFFSEIPGPDPEMDTIDYLVKAAAQFGNALGGSLYNDKGERLDKEMLSSLYEEIGELDRKEWERALSKHY